ncbi:30S ribosomal protein S20 [Borrelia sp. BU AG58]|uniref:30S ribosomal protein S20 n=1 Tax=Borrelia sp. BU AG58 TaxID=2887345 RepID=UPI001E416374|nr:30S ribosomal protein S20 [Borrelia sp. BU AG58]UER67424.1 30S ribosomal protein S20 [Borrelia sp. BU AG58]
MGNSPSALKRARQNLRRNLRNSGVRSELKTVEKRCVGMLREGRREEALEFFRFVSKKLDTAARKGIIHKNRAARRKSSLSVLLLK